ncbi:MAG: Heme-binding protein A precursor [bacterium ADurb.Bin243]|nr:MAG: Heme-binding protein A precursor [bacterium ADurb.Bin243]
MKKFKNFLGVCVFILLFAVTLFYDNLIDLCSGVKPKESTLIYGRAYDAISLDPPNQWDGSSSGIINNVYENLVQFIEGSAKLEPVLAESWKISDNLLEYTFNLRKNVFFHDSSRFDADCVVFNIERQMQKNHPYRLGNCECFESNFGLLESVKKIDEHTVVFKLKKPFTPFLELLAMTPMAIASPAAVKKHGAEFYKNPCGTGPFIFKKWIRDDSIVLEKNKAYWREKARVDKIIFKTIPDNRLRLMQLYSGLINIMDGINPDDIETIKRNPEITLLTETGMNVGYIAMNTLKPPFDKKEVRLAVNHAVNKKAIINFLYQQTATLAKNPLPPNIFGYNNEISGYPYDIAEARRLLKLAGLENGFKTKLFVIPITTMSFPEPDKVADAIAANLKDAGITVEKYSCEWSEYQSKVMNGEHEMAMFVWSADIPDPDNFLYVLLDSDNTIKGQAQNVSFYVNDVLHYTLMKAQSALDPAERTALYKKAQEIIHEDAPWVPFTHANQMIAFRKNVKNIKLSPVTFECYRNIEISESGN